MSRTVVLDTGPLGMASHPRPTGQNLACYEWVMALVERGDRVIVPEIAYYEVRRELLHAGKATGLRRLDAVVSSLEYVPINTPAVLKAAEFWAEARRRGRPTSDDKALDGDVILAAQAVLLAADDLIVATTNIAHFAQFVAAELWSDVAAE